MKGLENTITEHEMDSASRQFVQGLGNDSSDLEPDLTVDGLSESILSRLFQLFSFRGN